MKYVGEYYLPDFPYAPSTPIVNEELKIRIMERSSNYCFDEFWREQLGIFTEKLINTSKIRIQFYDVFDMKKFNELQSLYLLSMYLVKSFQCHPYPILVRYSEDKNSHLHTEGHSHGYNVIWYKGTLRTFDDNDFNNTLLFLKRLKEIRDFGSKTSRFFRAITLFQHLIYEDNIFERIHLQVRILESFLDMSTRETQGKIIFSNRLSFFLKELNPIFEEVYQLRNNISHLNELTHKIIHLNLEDEVRMTNLMFQLEELIRYIIKTILQSEELLLHFSEKISEFWLLDDTEKNLIWRQEKFLLQL